MVKSPPKMFLEVLKRFLGRFQTKSELKNARKCPRTIRNRYTGTLWGLKILAPILNRFLGGLGHFMTRNRLFTYFSRCNKNLYLITPDYYACPFTNAILIFGCIIRIDSKILQCLPKLKDFLNSKRGNEVNVVHA